MIIGAYNVVRQINWNSQEASFCRFLQLVLTMHMNVITSCIYLDHVECVVPHCALVNIDYTSWLKMKGISEHFLSITCPKINTDLMV